MSRNDRLAFRLHRGGDVGIVHPRIERLLIAGWAGRDQAAVTHHVDELARLGVAPPSRTPLFYAAAPALLTQDRALHVLGGSTSGEAEPLLMNDGGGLLVGLGSDHTDRAAEAWSVPHAKYLCGKPVAGELWCLDEVAAHWDTIILRAWIRDDSEAEWTLYQEGTLAELRRPEELAALSGGLEPGAAMLCGTLPAKGGVRAAECFRMELVDDTLGRRIAHDYRAVPLPIVA